MTNPHDREADSKECYIPIANMNPNVLRLQGESVVVTGVATAIGGDSKDDGSAKWELNPYQNQSIMYTF